jgi:oxygen-independent coproporphyrinogen-3 oxidase
MNDLNLIKKYNVAGPRYTSYPTVPFWKEPDLTSASWILSVKQNIIENNSYEVSLYIHLPFCESLCTFCGCHKRITKNHALEAPYIDTLLKEWKLYLSVFPDLKIKELHLGGGTPTFFAPHELKRLLTGLFEKDSVDPESIELGFEAHPNNTSAEHLQTLFDFGFRRVSFGIQDYDLKVQQAIHRYQPFTKVKEVHEMARHIGYTSISHDLVYGLPKQHAEGIELTILRTLELLPDRISLYGYAHVPWIKGNGQRGFDDNDIPKDEEKRNLYELAKKMLVEASYLEVGMDHFALPADPLAVAFKNQSLHRNFMGYTTKNTPAMIGLGMSAISDSWFGFAQNEKEVETYSKRIEQGELAIFRGHLLTEKDLLIRKHILDLMCHFETTLSSDPQWNELYNTILDRLEAMISDGLVVHEKDNVKVTERGMAFVRNCCMAFDEYLHEQTSDKPIFSQTV